jgi:DNA invertase Pin-like site-specific DNA recombinase
MSTQGQDLAQQRAALRGAGCSRVFEKVSGAKRDRPQLERLLDHLRVGDVVAVTRSDRLARPPATFWRSQSAYRTLGRVSVR